LAANRASHAADIGRMLGLLA